MWNIVVTDLENNKKSYFNIYLKNNESVVTGYSRYDNKTVPLSDNDYANFLDYIRLHSFNRPLGMIGEYNLYADQYNLVHFFKNNIEDIRLFLLFNGKNGIYNDDNNSSLQENIKDFFKFLKQEIFNKKNATSLLVYVGSIMIAFNLSLDLTIGKGGREALEWEKNASYVSCSEIDDLIARINSLDNLSQDDKNTLANREYLQLIYDYSNGEICNKLGWGINVITCNEDNVPYMEDNSISGFYNAATEYNIYIRDNLKKESREKTITHEFAHYAQNPNCPRFIQEITADIASEIVHGDSNSAYYKGYFNYNLLLHLVGEEAIYNYAYDLSQNNDKLFKIELCKYMTTKEYEKFIDLLDSRESKKITDEKYNEKVTDSILNIYEKKYGIDTANKIRRYMNIIKFNCFDTDKISLSVEDAIYLGLVSSEEKKAYQYLKLIDEIEVSSYKEKDTGYVISKQEETELYTPFIKQLNTYKAIDEGYLKVQYYHAIDILEDTEIPFGYDLTGEEKTINIYTYKCEPISIKTDDNKPTSFTFNADDVMQHIVLNESFYNMDCPNFILNLKRKDVSRDRENFNESFKNYCLLRIIVGDKALDELVYNNDELFKNELCNYMSLEEYNTFFSLLNEENIESLQFIKDNLLNIYTSKYGEESRNKIVEILSRISFNSKYNDQVSISLKDAIELNIAEVSEKNYSRYIRNYTKEEFKQLNPNNFSEIYDYDKFNVYFRITQEGYKQAMLPKSERKFEIVFEGGGDEYYYCGEKISEDKMVELGFATKTYEHTIEVYDNQNIPDGYQPSPQTNTKTKYNLKLNDYHIVNSNDDTTIDSRSIISCSLEDIINATSKNDFIQNLNCPSVIRKLVLLDENKDVYSDYYFDYNYGSHSYHLLKLLVGEEQLKLYAYDQNNIEENNFKTTICNYMSIDNYNTLIELLNLESFNNEDKEIDYQKIDSLYNILFDAITNKYGEELSYKLRILFTNRNAYDNELDYVTLDLEEALKIGVLTYEEKNYKAYSREITKDEANEYHYTNKLNDNEEIRVETRVCEAYRSKFCDDGVTPLVILNDDYTCTYNGEVFDYPIALNAGYIEEVNYHIIKITDEEEIPERYEFTGETGKMNVYYYKCSPQRRIIDGFDGEEKDLFNYNVNELVNYISNPKVDNSSLVENYEEDNNCNIGISR